MIDDQRPGDAETVESGQTGARRVTRRQLMIGASALGISAAAGVSLLAGCAAGSAGAQSGAGQSGSPGPSNDPWLGYPLPGDLRPDAPELARRGPFKVGVRGFTVTNPDQLDMVHYSAADTNPRYDRPLPLQVWYPAVLTGRERELTTYADSLGSGPNDPTRPVVPFTFPGRALRDAATRPEPGPYPLLIVSHGYPGSDVLLTNLTENLASKGYVVVAISHTDSTHADATVFASTLRNRALDINFVLATMGRLAGRARAASCRASSTPTTRR